MIYSSKKIYPKILVYGKFIRLVALLLVQQMIVGQYVLPGERKAVVSEQLKYLSPYLQISNLDLQNSFAVQSRGKDTGNIQYGTLSREFSLRTRNEQIEKIENGELKDEIFDVFIAGGGIAGTSVARDAASRGLSTMVVSAGDWAGGASSRSTKMLHGGVRYLDVAWDNIKQAAAVLLSLYNIHCWKKDKVKAIFKNLKNAWINLRFIYCSLHERNIIAEKTPQITKIKQIYMVISKDDHRSPVIAYIGMLFYWALSGFSMPRPQLYLSAKAIEKEFPELNAKMVKGITTFSEYSTDDALLTLYTVKDAYHHGAITLNYAPVNKVEYDKKNNYYVITISDTGTLLHDKDIKIKARSFVNAAGEMIDYLHDKGLEDDDVKQAAYAYRLNGKAFIKRAIGAHIFIPKAAVVPNTMTNNRSYLMTVPGIYSARRNIFMINRNETEDSKAEYFLLDTRDWDIDKGSGHGDKAAEEIEFTLKKINQVFAEAHITNAGGLGTDWGIKPLPAVDTSDIGSIPREHKIVELKGRYYVLMGVKITDGRRAAEETVDMICKTRGLTGINYKSRTKQMPFNIPDKIYNKTPYDSWQNEMVVYANDIGLRRYGPRFHIPDKAAIVHEKNTQGITDGLRSRLPYSGNVNEIKELNQIPLASELGVKTIVFDYGNVFRSFDYARTADEIHERYGIDKKIVEDYFESRESDRTHWMFRYDKGMITKSQAAEEFQDWIQQNSKHKSLILTEDDFDSLLWKCWKEPVKEMYGMLEAVIEKGYNVKIMTTTNPSHYRYIVNDLAALLPNGEKDIYASYILNFDKRQGGGYQLIIDETGGQPEEYLFIDDVYENLLAAKSTGMQVELFKPGEIKQSIASIISVLKRNVDAFLNGFEILEVKKYLVDLVGYMYGAYGISKLDAEKMLNIISIAPDSKRAIEFVYKHGYRWTDPDNEYGAKYKAYKTSIQPDIRSDLVRKFVKGNVIVDIATGNMSMLHKIIEPLNNITSAIGTDIISADELEVIGKKAKEKDPRLDFIQQTKPDKLPEEIKDNSADTVTIIGALHHMTDEVISSILKEALRILKPDGQLVILEDTDSEIEPMNFPGAYKEEVRQELSGKFRGLSPKHKKYVFAIVDWMGNHLVQNVTNIPLNFNFKTKEEWEDIFYKAGFEVEDEAYPGITPYKFHTHPELIFKLKPINAKGQKGLARTNPVAFSREILEIRRMPAELTDADKLIERAI